MKQSISHWFTILAFIFIVMTAAAVAQQKSLGEAARQARKNKPAEPTTKVITNDDIASPPSKPADSPAQSSTATASNAASTAASEKSATDSKSDAKPNLSAGEQTTVDKEWQDKVAAQKDQISLLERELDVLQRENKLRAATFYGDAGNRLRDEKKYAEDDRKYRDQIDAKQKELDAAKAKLDQIRDDARKAGASAG